MKKDVFQIVEDFIKTAKKPLLALIGPTASGKTTASIEIAKKYNCEIINADSRQMFKGIDIATAKVKPSETAGIIHHLFSFLEPNQLFTVAEWKKLAEEKAEEILSRGKIPLLCGGTGLYINAITKNFQIPAVAPQKGLREDLEKLSNEELWQKLNENDPVSAEKIHQNNRRYLIRAVEIFEESQQTKSTKEAVLTPKFENLILGVAVNRAKLYERIDQRVFAMLEEDFLEEVKGLLKMGYVRENPGMISHGIPEAIDFLENKISREEMIDKMQQNTRNYAKRQLSWWRRDERVFWFDPANYTLTEGVEF